MILELVAAQLHHNILPSVDPFHLLYYMGQSMVNSETPQNVRATVPVDRSSFKKKFKCLKGKKKLPTWNLSNQE
jgi:hypothetical protein